MGLEIELNKNNEVSNTNRLSRFIYLICAVCTSIIGYNIHNSLFWSIMDFLFMPITWLYWLVTKQINLSIIKEAFSFFLN